VRKLFVRCIVDFYLKVLVFCNVGKALVVSFVGLKGVE
jgi:hypothetical protein